MVARGPIANSGSSESGTKRNFDERSLNQATRSISGLLDRYKLLLNPPRDSEISVVIPRELATNRVKVATSLAVLKYGSTGRLACIIKDSREPLASPKGWNKYSLLNSPAEKNSNS